MELSEILISRPCAIISVPIGVTTFEVGYRLLEYLQSHQIPEIKKYALCSFNQEILESKDIYQLNYQHLLELNSNNSIPIEDQKKLLILLGDNYSKEVLKIHMVKNSIIIFDSAESVIKLIGIDNIKYLIEKNNIVIILYTLGITDTIMNQLSVELPGGLYANTKFEDLGTTINFDYHISKMSTFQNKIYNQYRTEELKEQSPGSRQKIIRDNFVNSQQICNIVYPENIQNFLNTNPNTLSIRNVVSQCGDTLLEGSEKLKNLLTNLIKNKGKNQLIFTKYYLHYGMELLKEFLLSKSIKVYTLDWEYSMDLIDNEINLFNNDISEYKVLITTTPYFHHIIPKNITEIHMLDGSLENTLILILNIYKYHNYSYENPVLNINYYITQNNKASTESSADTILYMQHTEKLEFDIKYFNALSKGGKQIQMISGKLIVEGY